MNFEKVTRQFLTDFQEVCKTSYAAGSKAIELATRPVVHGYIESLVTLVEKKPQTIILHHDVNYTRNDRPDWRLEDRETFGIYCFGDHKSLSLVKPFTPTPSELKQIERYINLGRPVFIFDGLEFLFFYDDVHKPRRESIISKPQSLSDNWAVQYINPAIETEFRQLVDNPGYRKWTESQLISQLAYRARNLSEELKELLESPLGSGFSVDENELIASLHTLKTLIENHHDQSLADVNACSDFISQVLTFGLFYAHTRNPIDETLPDARKSAIRKFWDTSNLDSITAKLRPFKSIMEKLNPVVNQDNVLSDWYKEVLGVLAHAEFMGTKQSELDFHSLFETFLDKFDSQTRFDRGAFYTPMMLSNWTVKFTNSLSKNYFSGTIYEVADKIVDPCCGTGSFLEAIYNQYTGSSLVELVGLEILPAPYALAHYRMSEIGATDGEGISLEILLADTLSDHILQSTKTIDEGFSKERELASNSCHSPIKIVIGNPPSSNHPANSAPRKIIQGLLDDFRPPKSDIGDRQNIQKALNNEAFRFLRWCCERVIKNNDGIVSLVLPGAFTSAISFKGARKWLLEKFNYIYILDVDGDARTNDAKNSIFSVLQGRIVIFCVKKASSNLDHKVFFLDITNKEKSEKRKFLESTPNFNDFEEVNINEINLSFTPAKKYPVDKWNNYWPLTSKESSIFKHKCSGIKLAPTSVLFHTNEAILLRRAKNLSKFTSSNNELIKKWFSGQKKPPTESKLTEEVKNCLAKINANDVTDYMFRPFLYGKVINNDELFSALKAAPGEGTRARPEIREAFSKGAVGIAVAPNTKDIGSTLTRFVSFCWALPDNELATRGNGMIHCDKFVYKDKNKKKTYGSNINSEILDLFKFSKNPERSVVYYVYAIMSSSSYLDTFEGILYGPSNPEFPPRIPVARDEEKRREIVLLGKKIAELEGPNVTIDTSKNIKLLEDDIPNGFKLKNHKYNPISQTLRLISDNNLKLSVHIPEDIYNLRISGHHVVEKWLRERKFSYYKKEIDKSTMHAFIKVLSSIEKQIIYLKEIDIIVDELITSNDIVICK